MKGAPTTQLYDGKSFKSTTGITYFYVQDYWCYPVLKAPAPKTVDNEKEVEILPDPCDGYKRMLELQRDKKKEAAAFVTKDGKVFILPMQKNTTLKSETLNTYDDSQGRRMMTIYRAEASDAPDLVPGSWYLTTATYDAQGRPTHTTYLVDRHVHTHPTNGHENEVSPTDKEFDKGGNFPGLDKYIVNESNMVKYDQTGALSTTPNACK